MTRKDYVAIAQAISKTSLYVAGAEFQHAVSVHHKRVAEALADVMGAENKRFDRTRFLKACGVQS